MKQYLFVALACMIPAMALAMEYEVGPEKPYETPGDVPWEDIAAGDVVLIHAREEPYRDKWVMSYSGTEDDPVTVRGVPDTNGVLPVIDGNAATTPTNLWYWAGHRGVIKIGGANIPPGDYPEYIVLENLDIRSARPPYTFLDDEGQSRPYKNLAASVFIESGANVTIRGCILQDSANGLWSSHSSSNVVVEHCYILDNGMEASIAQHNIYTQSQGILFQFNRLGHLRTGCLGNNLKDRSAGTIVRYNWIEGGSRQLDLVEGENADIWNHPAYGTSFVYGNILIESSNEGNGQICHHGGDLGDPSKYRNGLLHFYNNTVISARSDKTTLLRMSTDDNACDARNNVVYTTAGSGNLAILAEFGSVELRHNWLKEGWVASHTDPNADVEDVEGNLTGTAPGFIEYEAQDFHLLSNSVCVDAGGSLNDAVLPANNVVAEYVKHLASTSRFEDAVLDMGAYEVIQIASDDSDHDGMPDDWEREHAGSLTSMTSETDQDQDGALDWQEFVAGTDPTNNRSTLAILSTVLGEGASRIIAWDSRHGRMYRLLCTTSLTDGAASIPVATNLPATVPLNVYTDQVPASDALYYRVEIER